MKTNESHSVKINAPQSKEVSLLTRRWNVGTEFIQIRILSNYHSFRH